MPIYRCVTCSIEDNRKRSKGNEPLCCGCVMEYLRPSPLNRKNKMLKDHMGQEFKSIEAAVESKLEGCNYDAGELETMSYRISKLIAFAEKMTALLIKKKIITEEEAEELL